MRYAVSGAQSELQIVAKNATGDRSELNVQVLYKGKAIAQGTVYGQSHEYKRLPRKQLANDLL